LSPKGFKTIILNSTSYRQWPN